MWPFFNPTIKVVTFRLRGWCVLGVVFVAGIHPSRTWTSGSFESMWWNACVHRLDLGLYSHPKEFLGGMEFEPMLTPREKSPLPKMSPEEDRTRDAVDSEPKHYQRSYSGPAVYFLGHRSPEWHWPKQQWWAPRISNGVPSTVHVLLWLGLRGVLLYLCVPRAFLWWHRMGLTGFSDWQAVRVRLLRALPSKLCHGGHNKSNLYSAIRH